MRKKSQNELVVFYTLKRLIDIVGSIVLLTLFSPVLIVIAIIIKLTSPGPVLVDKENSHMKRLGKNRKIFRLYKFRSMLDRGDVLERTDPRFRKVYEEKRKSGNWKTTNDPRITPIGKFIRSTSLDEFPQLFNVLKGEMSIVGPRPFLPDELDEQMAKFPGMEEFVRDALSVKPGITGFWQVSGRSEVNFDKRIEMSAYYARKKSLILDLLILIKTPWAMITGKGAKGF